jgi:hypothetical protein
MIQELEGLLSVSYSVPKDTPECKQFCNTKLLKTLRSNPLPSLLQQLFKKLMPDVLGLVQPNPSSKSIGVEGARSRCVCISNSAIQSFLNLCFFLILPA